MLIKEGNCGKNSTKLVMSHRHLKNEIYPMESQLIDFSELDHLKLQHISVLF